MEKTELAFWLFIVTILAIAICIGYWITSLCIEYPETAFKIVMTSIIGSIVFTIVTRGIDRIK